VVVIGGLVGILIGLAIGIARAAAEEHAWQAIAVERRRLADQRRSTACNNCPVRRG
jgi:hypothetical protein